MTELIVTTKAGDVRTIHAPAGVNVIEAIRDAGIDELLALCGGALSCATCHVHVDPDDVAALPPMSQDEDDLLESSEHRDATSRLSCQIHTSATLARLAVAIAED